MAGTGSSVSRTIEATVAFGDERVTFQSVPARHSAPPAPPSRLRIVLDVHLVSHTHWDREWYLPVERFRQRLVALVDELIDDPPEAEESFLLDGQAIVLDDYVRVRPDRARAIGELLRERRLEAGPWYVLADELIPSGEALVRNLLAGRRTLARFGASAPPVLYCPDSFGHPAALPSIAAGFGLGVVVLWRGYGSRRFPPGDTAWWTAPGGERVLLYHLSRSGYELASNLPVDAAGAEARWAAMREQLAPRSTTGVVLLPHGADHHARQVEYRAAVNAVEAAGARDAVHRSSLLRFQRALVERASNAALPSVDGELRDSYGYTWTLARHVRHARAREASERTRRASADPRRRAVERARVTRQAVAPRTARRGLAHAARGPPARHAVRLLHRRRRRGDGAAFGFGDQSSRGRARGRRARPRRPRCRPWRARRKRNGSQWRSFEIRRQGGGPASPSSRSKSSSPTFRSAQARRRSRQPRSTASPRRTPSIAGLGAVQVLGRETRNARVESPRHYPDNDLVSRDSRRGVGRRRAGVRNRLAADRSPRARGRRTDGSRDDDASFDAKTLARRQRRPRWHS